MASAVLSFSWSNLLFILCHMWSLAALILMADTARWHSCWIMRLPLAIVLVRISHSFEAQISDLIETVDQDHTKPLCQFSTELEMPAGFAI